MSNTYIKPLYKKIYDEDFNYGDFGKRMKMQKCIYLLEQFGLNVGDYDFTWYKHGPYSQRLQEDMYEENSRGTVELRYSDFALGIIGKLTDMVNICHSRDFGYSEEEWMECLASVHYLNCLFAGNQSKALEALIQRKPHLNNRELNNKAYNQIASFS